MNRRSLTPSPGTIQVPGMPAQRRGTGGARREISARVVLLADGMELDGWALNISRGGIRVVIEERVELGQQFVIQGWNPDNADAPPRHCRVVWIQDEPDGSVLGMEFLDAEPPGCSFSSTPPGTRSSFPPP